MRVAERSATLRDPLPLAPEALVNRRPTRLTRSFSQASTCPNGTGPFNSEVYVADAIDYVQDGVILRYSPEGELLDEFYGGVIPGAFCWR